MAVGGGTQVEEKEFDLSTELLMRQLLKLDGIEAEGEAKLQRKAEVRIYCINCCITFIFVLLPCATYNLPCSLFALPVTFGEINSLQTPEREG